METPERLLDQLQNLDSLESIVKTMKALSAANINQYEAAIESLKEYFHTIELGLQVALQDYDQDIGLTMQGEHRRAAILFGSDLGLCGSFNEGIVQYALDDRQNPEANSVGTTQAEASLYLVVGLRAAGLLEDGGETVDAAFLLPGSARGISTTVQQVLLRIDRWRQVSHVDQVDIFYNQYLSTGMYQATRLRLLPMDIQSFSTQDHSRWPSRSLPTFSMNSKALVGALLRQYFFVTIFRACAESQASEHFTRLNTMYGAGKNIDSRIGELTASYRRVRQASITNELLDITSGFDATTSRTE